MTRGKQVAPTRKLQLRPSRTHANGRRPREGFFFSPRLISGTTQRPDDARSLLLAAGWLCDSLRRPAHARGRARYYRAHCRLASARESGTETQKEGE